ncbi:MAG: c-type cytochrome [Georgfuchsia sp.]
MPKHIARLVFLLLAFAVIAYAAKQYFTTDTFYLFGHYRGFSVAEIASDKPKYKTSKYCEQCHAGQYAEWAKGVHNNVELGKVVKCEVCHGPAGSRDVKGRFDNVVTGKDHPNGLKMTVPTETAKLCTLCHEQMPARPGQQRQIVVSTHAGSQQCTVCHNPHSPRIFNVAASPVSQGDVVAGRVIAAGCEGCHGEAGIGANDSGPGLAGQKVDYLILALKAYKSGARAEPVMSAMAQELSDNDIDNVVAYFSTSKCESAGNGDKKAAAAGLPVAAKCAACHGAKGISTQSSWPNLAGLSGEYLVSSFKSYKSGERKNGMMEGIAKNMSDADASNVAAYFANAACR